MAAVGLYAFLADMAGVPLKEPKALPGFAETVPQCLKDTIWGDGIPGHILNAIIVILALANWISYSRLTELLYNQAELKRDEEHEFEQPWKKGDFWHEKTLNDLVEMVSLVVFTIITVIRLAFIPMHPVWGQFGWSAIPRYIVSNIYMLLEVVALVSSYHGLTQIFEGDEHDDMNLLWLFIARSFEMLEKSGMGLGARKLKHMIVDDGKLLATSFVLGMVVWVMMGGMYYIFMRGSGDDDDAVWKVVTHDEKKWLRFESIPSTMFFVLINLLKEHPLADAHKDFPQRLMVIICCVFAFPLFAIPTSILQYCLFKADHTVAAEDADQAGQKPLPLEAKPDASAAPAAANGAGAGGGDGDGAAAAAGEGEGEPAEEAVVVARCFQSNQDVFECAVVSFLTIGSIVAFFYYTARDHYYGKINDAAIITPGRLAIIDGIVAAIFCGEWLFRLIHGRLAYAITPMFFVDLLAWVPGFAHVDLYLTRKTDENDSFSANEFLCAACVLRIFKLERYFQAYLDIGKICRERKGLLLATLLLCFLNWLLFSELLTYTERSNPDPAMRKEFASTPRSMWAEVINLHGEWPWCDYTAEGKGIGTIIGFFSIMIFCIPISVFSEGFQDKINERRDPEADKDFDRRPWQQLCQPEGPSVNRIVYDMLYGYLHPGPNEFVVPFRLLRMLNVLTVGLSVTVTLVSTLQIGTVCGYHDEEEKKPIKECDAFDRLHLVGEVIDYWSVFLFSVDFLLRIVATGPQHVLSFTGLVDVVSTTAIILSLKPAYRKQIFPPDFTHIQTDGVTIDDFIVPLRLLRLFSLESYLQALHVLRNVFYLNRLPLMRAGFALISFWFVHATSLYLFEAGHAGDEADEDMQHRYESVLRGLQYSIVHIFGDFPETEYTLGSKIIHFIGILAGIGLMGVFTGTFCGGFTQYLKDQRREELRLCVEKRLHQATGAVLHIQHAFRRQRRRGGGGGGAGAVTRQQMPAWRRAAREIYFDSSRRAQVLNRLFELAVLVGLVNTMASSMPEVDKHPRWEKTCLFVEFVCTVIFFLDYTVKIVAVPNTICSFFRFTDLICLTPGVCSIVNYLVNEDKAPIKEGVFEAFALLRAVRILDFPIFRKEVAIIMKALWEALDLLEEPAYLALNVWITTSALFMWLEHEFHRKKKDGGFGGEKDNMSSVPAAMYWCSIFLIGEWANVDFTYAGSRLSIFYVFFGIAMFTIPVGIIADAVKHAITTEADQQKMVEAMLKQAQDKRAAEESPKQRSELCEAASAY